MGIILIHWCCVWDHCHAEKGSCSHRFPGGIACSIKISCSFFYVIIIPYCWQDPQHHWLTCSPTPWQSLPLKKSLKSRFLSELFILTWMTLPLLTSDIPYWQLNWKFWIWIESDGVTLHVTQFLCNLAHKSLFPYLMKLPFDRSPVKGQSGPVSNFTACLRLEPRPTVIRWQQ